MSNITARGRTNWNYNNRTGSYSANINNLKEENLVLIATADNSNRCTESSASVSVGTIKLLDSNFDKFGGMQGDVSQRYYLYNWETTEKSGRLTISFDDWGDASMSFAVVLN